MMFGKLMFGKITSGTEKNNNITVQKAVFREVFSCVFA